ncbi:glycosyltransferase family 4 protein [Dyella subtropica]|uniref:glycosyltransferase family 4 protein n=1 Tax=Dyella subtropica TaxID=2992127 RepID=UPI002254F9B2|nr:glycosyltransferase family 4 protein [Dyella subtropica]
MRILFVCKRHPQQRDLIERPYGRFFHLPKVLAARGHEVQVLLCSHHRLPSLRRHFEGIDWISHDFRTLGPYRLLQTAKHEAETFKPNWVVGFSDTYCGWLAGHLAERTRAHLAIDAYDNFEAYMQWNLPLHWMWRRAVRSADLVTAAGPQLARLLQSHRRNGHPVEVLPMAADPEFVPLDRMQCRERLALPSHATLAGYIGSWATNRGSGLLIEAFRRARSVQKNLQLVLSGRPPEYALKEPGVIALGYIPDDQLPVLINALDIACVITADTNFGRYSYPAKLCEAMACGVPVAATATDPVRWMLDGRKEHLAPVGDADALAQRMLDLIASPRADYGLTAGWTTLAERLDYLLTHADRSMR